MLNKAFKFIILLISTSVIFAEAININFNLQDIKSEYDLKNYQKVINISQEYLKKFPEDYDVRLYEALSLYQLNEDNKAAIIFKEILDKYPKYDDARFGLINIYLKQKNYKEAEIQIEELKKFSENNESIKKYTDKITLAKKESNKLTTQKQLQKNQDKSKKNKITYLSHDEKLFQKAGLYYEKREFRQSLEVLVKIKDYKSNPKYKKLYDELNQITAYRYTPHFSLSVGNQTAHYMETGENWLFDHAIFSYSNAYSYYEIGLNQAKRYGEEEVQQFIKLYPIDNDSGSAYLGFRRSPVAVLYPNRTYDYGALINFNNIISGIFEGQFDRIRKTFLRRYTVGFEKYFGNYYFQFKPIYFVPKKGSNTLLYTYRLQKYYSASEFLGIYVGTGKSPDLEDLQTIGFFNIYNDFIFVNGQKGLTDNLFINLGVGYNKQRFPNDSERHFQNGVIGFKYIFV